jgi:hypothetical protein
MYTTPGGAGAYACKPGAQPMHKNATWRPAATYSSRSRARPALGAVRAGESTRHQLSTAARAKVGSSAQVPIRNHSMCMLVQFIWLHAQRTACGPGPPPLRCASRSRVFAAPAGLQRSLLPPWHPSGTHEAPGKCGMCQQHVHSPSERYLGGPVDLMSCHPAYLWRSCLFLLRPHLKPPACKTMHANASLKGASAACLCTPAPVLITMQHLFTPTRSPTGCPGFPAAHHSPDRAARGR